MIESKELQAFLSREWERQLREDPILATQIGDSRYNALLPDYSLDAVHRNQQAERAARSDLAAIDRNRLSEDDRLNYDLYAFYLDVLIQGQAFPEYLMPVNQLDGLHIRAPQFHDFHAFQTVSDYEDYLARLARIPVAMQQTIERLKSGVQQHVTPPQMPLRTVADQIRAQILEDATRSPFYEPLTGVSVPLSDAERLRKEAKRILDQAVVPAYRDLLQFWQDHYYPNARKSTAASDLPDGRAWYEYAVRRETTTSLSPEQIHELGLKEVQRIREEMMRVKEQAAFPGSYEEFVNFLKTDPQFFYKRAEDLVVGYRDICKRLDAEIPRFFGKLPRLTYGVHEIPEYAAPSMTTGFYDYGSLEAGRPAWYSVNTYRLDMRPKWEMEVLSIHESVPGHHLQLALAREMENMPAFRKYFNHTAFVEGWGLYSESLGPEMGFYKDPYSRFGWLSYDMWRAVRLVVDTGMHALGWSRTQAIDYFRANSSKTEQDITVEVDRYLVWPGQALAYKIGQLKILELRRRAEQRLGDAFNLRAFHDQLLSYGSLPLSILEKIL
ncbi:MAG TPA: DUF885 domain-containing protein [Acidobacteriota bacterium]|nr:DUF885 domain-containing protein [Acidobacteriota bacterium]